MTRFSIDALEICSLKFLSEQMNFFLANIRKTE
jgi:hypothetical protein